MFDGDVFQTVARDNHAALLRQAADDALADRAASESTLLAILATLRRKRAWDNFIHLARKRFVEGIATSGLKG